MKKILVIDDSADIRNLIRDALQRNGYDTLAAEDGLAGVQAAKAHLPDLILCDVRMPRLDGFGALAELRAFGPTATIPLIFLTGFAERDNFRQGMELGADDFLSKPFTIVELLAAVQARLEKQAALARQNEKKLEQLRDSISLALPHELLTPLNSILGFSALLTEPQIALRTEEVREFGRNIESAARRLQRLIENFLVYAQVQMWSCDPSPAGGLRAREPAPVSARLQPAALSCAKRWGREADLELCLGEISWPVSMETAEKIASEILDNAFKFSEPGSRVRVRTGTEGERAVLEIADCGRGMSAEQISQVGGHMQFERGAYEQQGAGLGLAIAKGLATLHGGQFRIESVPGAQTRVRVEFGARV